MFKQTRTSWVTPAGYTWDLCTDILEQTHVVIGGTTGSGKSTLLHSIIFSALIDSPAAKQFILIDLKGVELKRYKNLPHTIEYADTPEKAVHAIKTAEKIMQTRMNTLKRSDKVIFNGTEIYLIIDELAVLMQTAKAKILEPLANIMRLGRAAGVHVIGATQNPSRSKGGGLPSEIIQNCTAAIALRCRSAIESRQIIGISGAEKLPRVGAGYYWSPAGTYETSIPETDTNELNERINYWKTYNPIKARLRLWNWK